MIKKLLKLLRWGLPLGLLTCLLLLLISPFYIYNRFDIEIPVARLEFTRVGDYEYIASLSQGDFCDNREFVVLGDQFQLDAGFIKWKSLALVLGLDPLYRLDRLSGRYRDIDLQNRRPGLSHDLAPDVLFDLFDEPRVQDSGLLVDIAYGSSVYQDIDPALRYTVYSTEDGLIVRGEAAAPVSGENGTLRIEISQGCGGDDGRFRHALLGLNAWLNGLAG